MSFVYRKSLTPLSQGLRKNMTSEERKLWYVYLKKLPVTVKRQKMIHNFIIDFYIESKKIAIELDGRQHLTEENKLSDAQRDAELRGLGILVLRYPNESIRKDFLLVCEHIQKHIDER